MHLLFMKAKIIAYCDLPSYFYFQREDSILHTSSLLRYAHHFDAFYCRYRDIKRTYPEYASIALAELILVSQIIYLDIEKYTLDAAQKRMMLKKNEVYIYNFIQSL